MVDRDDGEIYIIPARSPPADSDHKVVISW